MTLILTNDDVAQLVTMAECIDIIEEGFRALGRGEASLRQISTASGATGTPPAPPLRSVSSRASSHRLELAETRSTGMPSTWMGTPYFIVTSPPA